MRTALVVASVVLTMVPLAAAPPAETARGIGTYGSFFAPTAKNAIGGPLTVQAKPVFPAVPRAPSTQSSSKRAIVCGMTLLPANPKVDPAMKVAPPKDRRFTMREVEPTICRGR